MYVLNSVNKPSRKSNNEHKEKEEEKNVRSKLSLSINCVKLFNTIEVKCEKIKKFSILFLIKNKNKKK